MEKVYKLLLSKARYLAVIALMFPLVAVGQYTVTTSVYPDDAGHISGNSGTYAANATVSLTATNNSGYEFDYWYDADLDEEVSYNSNYQFTITSSRELIAVFRAATTTYLISVDITPEEGGEVDLSGYQPLGVKTITATPNTGYSWLGWYDDEDELLEASESYTFNLTQNTYLVAKFIQDATPRTVTASANVADYGTVTLTNDTRSGASDFNDGETAIVAATPNDGYNFAHFTYNGDPVNPTSVVDGVDYYSFVVSEDAAVVAVFEAPATYTVTVGAVRYVHPGTGCSGSIVGDATVTGGSTVHLHASAAEGWYFIGWSTIASGNPIPGIVDGSNVEDFYYTVTGDITLYPCFDQTPTYTVTLAQAEGGSATVNGGTAAVVVSEGGSVTLAATANSAAPDFYTFTGWSTDNNDVIAAESPVTYVPSSNVTVTPLYTQNLPEYTASIVSTDNVTATVNGSSTSVVLTYGGVANYEAEVADCYAFDGWYSGETLVSTDNPYAFAVTADVSLKAQVSLITYNVTVNSAEHGTVTASAATVACGGTVSFTVTPDEGYHFAGWVEGGNATVYNNVSNNITLTPSFEANVHSVAVGVQGNGNVNGGAEIHDEVAYGTLVTIVATPATHYHFTGWTGDMTSNDATLEFTMGDANVSLVAHFEPDAIAVNVTVAGDGTVNGNDADFTVNTNYDGTVTLTAATDACHTFTGWSGAVTGTEATVNVPLTADVINVTATFDAVTYTVSATGEHGTFTYDPATTGCGITVNVTAVPDEGYSFVEWNDHTNANPRPVTLNSDVALVATFAYNNQTFVITKQVSPAEAETAGCTVSGPASFTEGGDPVSYTYTEAGYYHFQNWTINGENAGTAATLTFTPEAATTVAAVFAYDRPSYDVAITVTGEGTVNGEGNNTYSVLDGETLTLTAVAATDYTFGGWSGDATGNTASLTVTPTADMNITATFTYTPATYTLTASAYPANAGSISGNAGSYVHDTEVTLTANAEQHYHFVGWYNGSTLVSEEATYTFTIAANTTLEARFEADEYTITVTADPAEYGRVEYSGNTTYGSTFRMNAIANTGYHFVQWNDGNETASRSISVTGDANYVARFEANPDVPVTEPAADVLTYLDTTTRRVVTGIREDLRAHLTTVRIPSTVERIANRAFMGATSLINVTIPATVDTIGDSAFYMLPSLVSINLPNQLDYLGHHAFYGCSALESVSMPAVLDTLRQRTFAECTALRRIEIPATVKEVGAYALYNCDNIYQLTVPASVDTVRENAFYEMSGLRFVTIEGGNHHFANEAFRYNSWYWYNRPSYGSVQLTSFRGTLAEWMTNTFASNNANPMMQSSNFAVNGEILTDLVVPAGTDTIRPYAFYNDDQLVTITIPASVDTIGAYAFAELNGLEKIVLLGIPKVNEHAFDAVSNDVVVMVPCEKLDSIRDTGWSHFDKFYANGVPMLTFRNSYGGRATVLQEPTCTDFTARFEAVAGENYTFKAWSDGDTTNPRTMVLEQDEVIGAIWERIANPIPLESKTISFDVENTDANWYLEDGTTNKWYIGRGSDVAPRTGSSYLYISNDGGATNNYSEYSDAYTYTELYLNSGTYRIRFHWQADGHQPYGDTYGDYLKAYLLADGIDVNFDENRWNDDDIVLGDTLAVSDTWAYQNGFVNVPTAGWYKMIFYWRNQNYYNGNPGAAVDNIYIQFQDEDVLEDEYVTLRVVSADTNMGTVTGGGLFTFNEMVTVSATPKEGYQFDHWSDGSYDAEHTVRAGDFSGTNEQLVAYFADRQFHVTLHVTPENTALAQTSNEEYYFYTNDEVSLRVLEPQAGYAFLGWSTDGTEENIINTDDPYTFNITSDIELTAVMSNIATTVWVVRVVDEEGHVISEETYDEDPLTSGNPTPSGAINPDADGNIQVVEVLSAKIYSAMGQIVVEDANGQMVTVYDVNGRRLASKQDTVGKVVFDVPVTGTYMVKIGELITRKVVVMK